MKKLLLMLAAAAFIAVSCQEKPVTPDTPDTPETPETPEEPEEPEYVVPITIDGDFADWGKLDASKVVSAKSNADSPWDAVKEIRCYADELYVFYYIEYDNSQIADILAAVGGDANELPIRLNINTDGEFSSGYVKYSLDGYDFIIEGSLGADGAFSTYDGTLHQRIDDDWVELLASGSGLVTGAGSGNKYEIMLVRELFNAAASASTVPMPMGDTFQTGIRFYTPDWGELANMPDGAVTDDNTNGWGHLLEVTTVK